MEVEKILSKIKDNLLLIPSGRFASLIRDETYQVSFIYLIACLILSIPSMLIAGLARGSDILPALAGIPALLILTIPMAYLIYIIQFALLKILGGKASLKQSVQVFIYGSTSSLVLGPLPLIGIIPQLISLANVVTGSARVHGISLLRAVVALVIIPVFLFALIIIALILAAGSLYSGILGNPF